MQIKSLDLFKEYQNIKPEIHRAIVNIIQKANFIGGEPLREFENHFATFTQTKGCVGVGNGTDALEIAIKSLNLPKNSEIILPSNTFIASLEAILNTGHQAVLVDCGEDYLIDPIKIQNAITSKTSAIMVVHLYGRACDMESILKIANKHNLKIIEDCSQAHGAKILYHGKPKSIGSIGDIGCFSFYPGKNLGAYGDGGAIVSNEIDLIEKCKIIANHGIKNNKYDHSLVGRNSRLDTIQAAILDIKLKYLQTNNQYRQNISKIYDKHLSVFQNILLPPKTDYQDSNVWHLYVIRLINKFKGKRKIILDFLEKNNIACGIHYPQDLGSLPFINSLDNCKVSSNQYAKEYSKEILSLPIGTHIREKEIEYIANKFQELQNLIK
ncbi:hypothetical protein BKH44_03515 [Helicobacter sp. 13S00477-4]|nr:hypothetical protein BKH44_03515 [Helicobacter sp. 13S00477-4]